MKKKLLTALTLILCAASLAQAAGIQSLGVSPATTSQEAPDFYYNR